MARLIDADALVKALLDRSFFPYVVRRAIEKAPTIDAVSVVRCKDCRYCKSEAGYGIYCDHITSGLFGKPNEDDFCSYGERKDNE